MPSAAWVESDQLPRTSAQLTPAWLTNALRRTFGPETIVINREVQGIVNGNGLVCEIVRVWLSYQNGSVHLPRSVVAKLPGNDPVISRIARMNDMWRREAMFYAYLAPQMPSRIARCWHSEVVPETGEAVILLEDLSNLDCGEMVHGLDANRAERVVDWLAAFHAQHWGIGDELRFQHPWLLPAAYADADLAPLISLAWKGFIGKFGNGVPRSSIDTLQNLESRFANLVEDQQACLVHRDFRVDNLMFDSDNSVAVLDWQTLSIGSPMLDLGYFMATSLPVAVRRVHEEALLTRYCDRLEQYGVGSMSRSAIHQSYVGAVCRAAFISVCSGILDVPDNDPLMDRLQIMNQRTLTAVSDLIPAR